MVATMLRPTGALPGCISAGSSGSREATPGLVRGAAPGCGCSSRRQQGEAARDEEELGSENGGDGEPISGGVGCVSSLRTSKIAAQ
ncbi:hypothetical protein PR202_gb11736 [Eleusine coracana subsp. coracana]|uniref:Uncharacterized protein n=1 Tax=Eleusine coracana subsp. coracana TaxID=191504 RepID=A0AAV5EKY1_ELECO|nr:hypothetical protein PR202_gb11736 [Eleusine coracana subsp. coracana]